MSEHRTTCCVVGGGPAGLMLGYLLARAGVKVTVLEKHADFLRDFRGDTVHPSTLEVLDELGLLKSFLSRPHQEVSQLGGQFGTEGLLIADFKQLDTKCKFVAFVPQWEFLNFMSEKAKQFDTFDLRMNTQAVDVIEGDGKVIGIQAKTTSGEEVKIYADLVVGADGRHSIIRDKAGFQVTDVGAPMDVLWMRLSRKTSDPGDTLGRVGAGSFMVMLNREDYWQCGFVIAKGSLETLKEEGLDKFKERLVALAPFAADRMEELTNWDDIKLLTVKVDFLSRWHRPGLLCIGDAAHAMSPVGGVGINLAIQDAVATANILWKPLSENKCTDSDLAQVQKRRTYPTRMTQRLQVAIQNAVIRPILSASAEVKPPAPLQLFKIFPGLRKLPATIIGVGFRPEHVHCPKLASSNVAEATV